jgi:hypothetical protein
VFVLRPAALACLLLVAIPSHAMQGSTLLRIKVTIVDANQQTIPLARHALIVGDDPPSAAPRRTVTNAEGVAEIRVRPGRYIVESDEPSTVQGRAYRWNKSVDLAAGRDTTLELTSANAIAEVASGSVANDAPPPVNTEVTLWTENRRATGTLNANGVVEVTASDLGDATSVEVQLSPTEKFAGAVLSADPVKDVALVHFDRARRLPLESPRVLPLPEMRAVAAERVFNLAPYSSSSSEFDILFVTPVLLAKGKMQQGRTGAANARSVLRPVTEFGDWSEYVDEAPPVFFIRATPKRVESVWFKALRVAAYTQGARNMRPITRLGPGFSSMRLMCGTREIAPIHPFRIRSSVSETEDVEEGFYAFDPMAIGPHCGTVSVILSSVKDREKTETAVVPPAVVAQVWNDFAPYRIPR